MSSSPAPKDSVVHEAVDERQYIRAQLPCEVELRNDKQELIKCSLVDISLGGVCVQCDQVIRAGSLFDLRITVKLDGMQFMVQSQARAQWQQGRKLGMEFVDMARETRDVVRYFISSFLAGEITHVNGVFNVLQRENYIRGRKQKPVFQRSVQERVKAIAGSTAYLLICLAIVTLVGNKLINFFFRVDAANAIVTSDAYVLNMPENGYVRYLYREPGTMVSAGEPVATVSSQLMTSLTTVSDMKALADLSAADLDTLLGKTTVETVITSPCNCRLYIPAPANLQDRYLNKYEPVLHLLPVDKPMTIAASFPANRIASLAYISSVEAQIFGNARELTGTVTGSRLDSANDALILTIALDQSPDFNQYLQPAAVSVYTLPRWLSFTGTNTGSTTGTNTGDAVVTDGAIAADMAADDVEAER